MVRKPRLEYPGGIFHVIQRGNNREFIFKDAVDKGYFINQLKNLKPVMDYDVYGFVLMDNHFHLILRTNQEPLRAIMHRINYKYSRYFNRRYERKGHVFGGRYKAIPVDDDKYLLALLRYIHHNPIRAGICQRVEEHHWSSDYFYRTNNSDFVDINFILSMLSPKAGKAIPVYEKFMVADEIEDYKLVPSNKQPEAARARITRTESDKIKSLDDILRETTASEEDFDLIKQGSRNRILTPYKLAYVKQALKMQYTLEEIGANIKVSGVALLQLIRRNNTIS